MKMKYWQMILGLIVMLMATIVIADDTADTVKPEDVSDLATEAEIAEVATTFLVTYFHGDRRCATCIKLENYSQAAIATGFETELADSSVVWRTVNYDDEENQHYIDDYSLFTKAVIVSRMVGTEEVDWMNLSKIWDLVGDSAEFVDYVTTETGKFMAGDDDDD